MDPAYGEIGPDSCVGMTGNWASYSWPPAIILVSVMSIFLMDFAAERYVAKKYDLHHEPQCSHDGIEGAITSTSTSLIPRGTRARPACSATLPTP
jgi:zinc transporter 1/2/3